MAFSSIHAFAALDLLDFMRFFVIFMIYIYI